jgi:hypothetical protein
MVKGRVNLCPYSMSEPSWPVVHSVNFTCVLFYKIIYFTDYLKTFKASRVFKGPTNILKYPKRVFSRDFFSFVLISKHRILQNQIYKAKLPTFMSSVA